MTERRLRALATMHDLPVAWDGRPVTWGDWRSGRSSFEFHAPLDQLACRKCGLLESSQVAVGAVDELRVLYAFRCPGCRHDVVWDARTDETWDLDPSDYLDAGSTVDGSLW